MKTLTTSIGEILVRSFDERDIESQVSYLYDSPPEFLTGLGFDLKKLPGREETTKRYLENAKLDSEKHTFHSAVAEFENRTIAAIHLHLKKPPELARGHFHIFDPNLRGKGLGAPILKAGLSLLFAEHKLETIWIEPKSTNQPMNQLMHKCGFRFIGKSTYLGPVTYEFEANRYEVTVNNLEP